MAHGGRADNGRVVRGDGLFAGLLSLLGTGHARSDSSRVYHACKLVQICQLRDSTTVETAGDALLAHDNWSFFLILLLLLLVCCQCCSVLLVCSLYLCLSEYRKGNGVRISVLGFVQALAPIVAIIDGELLADHYRILGDAILVPHLLLPLQLLLLRLSRLLLNAYLQAIVEHVPNQVRLRDHVLLQGGHLRHILGLGRLDVQEGHKDAHLEHVHELLIEGFTGHFAVVHRLVVENLDLVLPDQE